MPPEYKGQDAAVYLKAVRDILPAFSEDGLMPNNGPATVKAFLDVSDESVREANIDLNMTYTTNSFRVNRGPKGSPTVLNVQTLSFALMKRRLRNLTFG
jgi:hypothetical protein